MLIITTSAFETYVRREGFFIKASFSSSVLLRKRLYESIVDPLDVIDRIRGRQSARGSAAVAMDKINSCF